MWQTYRMEKSKPTGRPSVLWIWTLAISALICYHLWQLAPASDLSRVTDPYVALSSHLHKSDDPLRDGLGRPTVDPDPKHLALGKHAMVACDVPLCSTMGKDILLKGGNAADAAITVALCIGSINSHSSGIGGGSILLSKLGNEVVSIDAREMAPKAAHKHMYDNMPLLSIIGGQAVAIPGELKGLYELHTRHGSGAISWADLFEPVIQLNRKGWECSFLFETILKIEYEKAFSLVPFLKKNWDYIFREDGELKRSGDLISRPAYADTLEKVAKNGSAAIFYDPDSELVKSMVDVIHEYGGIITADDFAAYEVKVEEPISVEIDFPKGKRTVYTASGVSSGLAMVAGLKFFSRVFKQETTRLYWHKLVESFKWVASVRTRFGDVDEEYKHQLVLNFTSDGWIDEILKEGGYSDEHTFDWQHYRPEYDIVESMGTSHFSVVDKDGNSVAMTTTVNLLFGSLVYDNSTGIVLNNEMDDFSTPKNQNSFNLTSSIYNYVDSHKRPLSSMSPTIIVNNNGRPEMMIGAAGGSRIVTAVLQAIIGVYYRNQTMLQTIAYPRLHHQLIPTDLMVENSTTLDEVTPGTIKYLQGKNHSIVDSGAISAMNGILWSEGKYHGVSDFWRKHGGADGY